MPLQGKAARSAVVMGRQQLRGGASSNILTRSELSSLTKLMSIGALLNLGAFFLFLKKNQDKRAQGVLIATILVFIATMIIKFFY